MSREVAKAASDTALTRWLQLHDFDVEGILEGKTSLSLVDNGYRSKVYSRLFHFLLSRISPNAPDTWEKVRRVFSSVHPWLITAHGDTDFRRLQSQVARGGYSDLDRLIGVFHYHIDHGSAVVFPQIFENNAELSEAGLPLELWERVGWLQDNWDRLNRHWVGRAMGINSDGTAVTAYERNGTRDNRVDKAAVIRTQLMLWDHFGSEQVLNKLAPALQALYDHATVPAGPLSLSATEVGKTVITPRGTPLRVVELVHTGDAKIWKVQILPLGTWAALKLPLDNSPASLAVIAGDARHHERLRALLGDNALSLIRESGPDYLLKDWVDGITAEEYLKKWEADGGSPNDDKIKALRFLITDLIHRGVYVRNLNPSHIIFTDGRATILNSGGINRGGSYTGPLPASDVTGDYRRSFARRWAPLLTRACADAFLAEMGLQGETKK
jgi:hypothetical protein